jgi:GDP-L-fucose synthase
VNITQHHGLAGSAVWRYVEQHGHRSLIGRNSSELDREYVFGFFAEVRPQYVVLPTAKVAGIPANSTRPTAFRPDNPRTQVDVLDAATAERAR